jgi:hypothetical protein
VPIEHAATAYRKKACCPEAFSGSALSAVRNSKIFSPSNLARRKKFDQKGTIYGALGFMDIRHACI